MKRTGWANDRREEAVKNDFEKARVQDAEHEKFGREKQNKKGGRQNPDE
jgi:hypothetical protein